MARYEYKPNLGAAPVIAVAALAMATCAGTLFVRSGHFSWPMVGWLGGVVFIGLVALSLSFVNEHDEDGPHGEDGTGNASWVPDQRD